MTSRSPIPFPGQPTPSVGFEAPFDMLSACHERVERSLALLERLMVHVARMGADASARQAALDVMRYFDLAAPLHHQDEELHVFPRLLAGPDVALQQLAHRLIAEHRSMELAWQEARASLVALVEETSGGEQAIGPPQRPVWPTDAQLAQLRAFAQLYRRHLSDEDRLVYPVALSHLDPSSLQHMGEEMEARRRAS
ncbi:hemerythrin domain-containing protein [Rhodoferax aquaticus]|uniref:Hemerythrin domain-containing protein n=1 Tax=Rhodoferax aquaticus TaxID=2527691 RepID=A0A515ET84_9BURK|nr:hemerythrin domain-containing protein [Rhodoferax aquaticus]QDL55861.1 hemerythrin domain-containing protein [Rhodoferax aquaticus]